MHDSGSHTEADRAAVTDHQRQVIDVIYAKFRQDNQWPTFGRVDRPLRRARIDPVAVIKSMPEALLHPLQAGRTQPVPNDKLQLTIRGIAACDGGDEDVEAFVSLLPWLAESEIDFEPSGKPGEDNLRVTSQEVAKFLGLAEGSGTLARLYEILQLERWGWGGGGSNAEDGSWNVIVTREIDKFSKVEMLADYLSVQAQWDAELVHQQITSQWITPTIWRPAEPGWSGQEAHTDSFPADNYVATSVIKSVEDKAVASSWNCDKLLQLIAELNENYRARNAYSAHAMLRAILDHVPPILGCRSFEEIASNYPWRTKTDRDYMKQLAAFKTQGHDALHRQISKTADALSFEHLPLPTGLNVLLMECADRL